MKCKIFCLILLAFAVIFISGCLGGKEVKMNQRAAQKQIQVNTDSDSRAKTNNSVPNPTSGKYACKADDDCGLCDCDVFQECANISWWQEKLGSDLECSCQKELCACKNEKCVKR